MSNGFDDNEQFVRQFIIETEEHLELIEANLLELEKETSSGQGFNQESINILFRAIHTIKGLSGMLEFNQLLNFTHIWESLLDKLRKKKLDLTPEIINIFFEGLDVLTKILDNIKKTKTDEAVSVNEIIARLEKIENSSTEPVLPKDRQVGEVDQIVARLSPLFQKSLLDFEKNKLLEKINAKTNIYQIRLFLNRDCFDKDISYLSTCINLEFIGEIINITTNINSVPPLENFDPEIFDLEIYILYSTAKDAETIYKTTRNPNLNIEEIDFHGPKKKPAASTDLPVETQPDNKKFLNNNDAVTGPITQVSQEILPSEKDISSESRLAEKTIDNLEREIAGKIKQSKLASQDTIRVETTRLDTLLALLGEQVISKTQLEHLSSEFVELLQNSDNAEVKKLKLYQIADNLNETISTFSRLSNELQEIVMRIRMLPIGNVFNRFNRVVRDLARDLGKQVELTITGEETELDKTIIEEISDPLIHIIRNAIDHGIERPEERKAKGKPEAGNLHFNAYQQGNSIVITIKDNGRGLNLGDIKAKALEKGLITPEMQLSDTEITNLIFEPGFSTAREVTGISGRGVGMDVVRKNITNLKGTIEIDSKENLGTTFIIKLPLTLAIIQALLVKVSDYVFAVPLSSVIESYRARKEEIKMLNNKPVLKLRDRVLPVLYFEDYFKLEKKENKKSFLYIVVIGMAESRVGIVVDGLIGQQEIVIKPLNDPLVRVNGIAGATLLGEGVTLIIDTIPIIMANQNIRKTEKVSLS